MKSDYKKTLDLLARNGWTIRRRSRPKALPKDIVARYGWVPNDVWNFVKETDLVITPDEKAWFITSSQLSGESGFAFSYNEWEILSLDAAGTDLKWQQRIRAFWDEHFTVLMSLKDGYAYFALRKEDLAIVCGEEPEFEEVVRMADSFADFLNKLRSGDPQFSPWI